MFIQTVDDLRVILNYYTINEGYSVYRFELFSKQIIQPFDKLKFKEVIYLTKRKELFDNLAEKSKSENDFIDIKQFKIDNNTLAKIMNSKFQLLYYVIIDPKNIRAFIKEVE